MIEPNILFEDSDILVIEKPAGAIVNRADTTKDVVTVQDWAEKKFKIQSRFDRDKIDGDSEFEKRGGVERTERSEGARLQAKRTGVEESEFYKRSGVVHRLDKETSGILIIAKNEESFVNLQKQFKEGRVKKTYIALCHGEIKPSEGEINIPIGRLPWNRMRFGVLPQGREATSKYKVLSIKYLSRTDAVRDKVSNRDREPLSFVEVYPETGRTHQIRVHMQYIKHPIFADELYAGRKVSKRDRKLLPRHFLHASRISFDHPTTGERVELESNLPPDLTNFLASLKD